MKKLTTEEFIEKARKIHGNLYDYSKVNYEHSNKKIKIVCVKHGVFEQTSNNHISAKQGCPKCAINNKFDNNKIFIEKANKIHDNVYDYSCVIYTNCFKKVCIICPKHGKFNQTPVAHLNSKHCW